MKKGNNTRYKKLKRGESRLGRCVLSRGTSTVFCTGGFLLVQVLALFGVVAIVPPMVATMKLLVATMGGLFLLIFLDLATAFLAFLAGLSSFLSAFTFAVTVGGRQGVGSAGP